MKIYISGPMTGLPELNFPAFHAEAKRLRDLGYDVVNPAELNPNGGSWNECLRKDIAALVECDAIKMLPGWQGSKGASLELDVARSLGIHIVGDGFSIGMFPSNWLLDGPAAMVPASFRSYSDSQKNEEPLGEPQDSYDYLSGLGDIEPKRIYRILKNAFNQDCTTGKHCPETCVEEGGYCQCKAENQ